MTPETTCFICNQIDEKLPIIQTGELCHKCALLFAQ